MPDWLSLVVHAVKKSIANMFIVFLQCMISIIGYLKILVLLKVVNRAIYDRNYLTMKNNLTFIFHYHIICRGFCL